jgi:hypothetical protein
VPGLPRGEHAFGLLEQREQLRGRLRELERLPHVARDLALQPRSVREHVAQLQLTVERHVEVRVEPVIEVEPPGVAQLHDRDRRQRLPDRPDAVLVLGRRLLAALRVREPDRVGQSA